VTPHLGDVTTAAHTCIITGDPDRVPALAHALGVTGPTWRRRGYVCVEAQYADEPVLVASTGIGGPTTAIVVEELWRLGVRQVIRVGTCGSMQPRVRPGEIVISCGAVRDEGTSVQYLPLSVPAVPDPVLLAEIVAAARRSGGRFHIGLTHCKDAYYAERPDGLPLAAQWTATWAMLRSVGVLATEMETAALFAVATVRGLQAAALLVAVDDTLSPDGTLASLQAAARVAVEGALAIRPQGGNVGAGR
jgi:uridine phosphorylase